LPNFGTSKYNETASVADDERFPDACYGDTMKRLLDLIDAPTDAPVAPSTETLVPVNGKTVFIESYGCQMNLNDSEIIRAILRDAGYGFVDRPDAADVVLLNTCAVREHAEERVFGRLAELAHLKHGNPNRALGVCGCMAQHLKSAIPERAPYVDLVMGPDAYRSLPNALAQIHDTPFLDVNLARTERYDDIAPVRADGVTAWLTIQRGCDKFCTFCIVPFVRGRERSVPLESLVEHARRLAEEGVKEVTLLGQTVNSYRDAGRDFADLLAAVADVDGIERVRFTSPHPSDATEAMIRVMATHPKVCKHIHLPLQAGSNDVLKRMRRTYTVEEYLSVLDALRTQVSGVAVTTDIIVGFPGETDADFRETVAVMERVRYDGAFMFKYSPRKGTTADRKFPDDVPDDVKGGRLRDIIALQENISREVYRSRIGANVNVLVEGVSKRNAQQLYGKSDDFKTTVFPRENASVGDLVQVRIEDASAHTLLGRVEAHSDRDGLLPRMRTSR
jgi:tRNA-2-methylthio-N6-dimethylallyladenosine synthase